MDREHIAHGQGIKDIYVYPLVRHARWRLCRRYERIEVAERNRVTRIQARLLSPAGVLNLSKVRYNQVAGAAMAKASPGQMRSRKDQTK